MHLREHDGKDAKKVWLDESEVEQLLGATDSTEHWIALALGARCGLRSHEILNVAPEHLVSDDRLGYVLRVPEGKGDQYREVPCPAEVARAIMTLSDARDAGAGTSVVTCTSTRTLRRWTAKAARDAGDDDGWDELTTHDLRRTWATNLAAGDVDPLIVCDWGGWSNLDVFLEHYRGTYSPARQAEARAKVDWL